MKSRSSRPSKPSPRGGVRTPQGRGGPRREPEIPKSWRAVAGTHAINEVLSVRPHQVKAVWLRQGWESSKDLRDLEEKLRRSKISFETKPLPVLDRLCASHQGAIVYVNGQPTLDIGGLESFDTSMILVLDGIEDPHNLGAILRTGWLMGAHGLVIPEDRAVGLTPTAHKVACGGAEHVPVHATHHFPSVIEPLKEQGYWVFGLSHKAKRSLLEFEIPKKIVWAIGAEDKGLRVPTEKLCDELVSIPQLDAAASYNASVAAALALMETRRQHGLRKS